MDNSITFAGEIDVSSVILRSINTGFSLDIVNQIVGINIYEDMFSPFITGSISVRESLDLISQVPLVGEEVLEFVIKTPGITDTIQGQFYIYKMTDREYLSDRNVVYSLHFISIEAIHNATKSISKKKSGKVSNVTEQILKTTDGLGTLKNCYIEETSNSITYISNFWSPIKNIDFLTKRALNKSNSPSYVFFENRSGFNFLSLDTLFTQPTYQKFRYDNSTRVIDGNSSYRDINRDYSRIQLLSIPDSYNYLDSTNNGKYASRMFKFDLLTKQFYAKNFEYEKIFNKTNHLNKFKPSSNNNIRKYNSVIFKHLDYSEVFTSSGKSTTHYDKQSRVSSLEIFRNNVVQISVPGRIDYTIGQKVELEIYKATTIDEDLSKSDKSSILDEINSGAYLITAINHVIHRNEHTCFIELSKDSLQIDLDK